MKLTKTFDHSWNGKCNSLEVTVEYDPSKDEAKVESVFAVQACYGFKEGKRWEDVPHAYIPMTEVLENCCPEFFDKMEAYDWSLVYAEHQDLVYTEQAA